jgi:hypothetical protein
MNDLQSALPTTPDLYSRFRIAQVFSEHELIQRARAHPRCQLMEHTMQQMGVGAQHV